ncbi:helix-turn-helix transcriptional regulator [Paenibacillus sp. 1781tsa1]|uniref:helix-turn-helix domain-containing protein n=1 Tax=Paenibacillus sp. 1781tsa1 TaxID=2953810 RepID=UPI0020A1678B|nr:helix-turn-helix transcriptional regulator [Paenibacillus sp. 1781tsa1]MCP1185031.1 helix-turn-helix transcriptional regulator [Paenibacillus sp. 1781tsa1]
MSSTDKNWWFEIKLQSILDSRRISNREFSRLTGIRHSTINDLCNNEVKSIPLKNLAIICEVLNIVDLNELIKVHK